MTEITLTFDNGPTPSVTEKVLETLAARAILATFFVIGRNVAEPAGRDLVQREHAAGHWIGNHTWSHTRPLGTITNPVEAVDEIRCAQDALATAGVVHPDRLFRPMGGGGAIGPWLLSAASVDYLAASGFTCVLWNSVPRDWERPDDWVERALEDCAKRDWTLIVLHDLPTGAMQHLPRFLDTVRDRGGRFRQDFPPDCVPLLAGRAVHPMTPYVAPTAPSDLAPNG